MAFFVLLDWGKTLSGLMPAADLHQCRNLWMRRGFQRWNEAPWVTTVFAFHLSLGCAAPIDLHVEGFGRKGQVNPQITPINISSFEDDTSALPQSFVSRKRCSKRQFFIWSGREKKTRLCYPSCQKILFAINERWLPSSMSMKMDPDLMWLADSCDIGIRRESCHWTHTSVLPSANSPKWLGMRLNFENCPCSTTAMALSSQLQRHTL